MASYAMPPGDGIKEYISDSEFEDNKRLMAAFNRKVAKKIKIKLKNNMPSGDGIKVDILNSE
jgi:hypothetical protein